MEHDDGTERREGMGMLGTHFGLIDDVEHACLVCCENANTIVISALENRRAQPWASRGWSGELCIVRLGRHSKSASITIATARQLRRARWEMISTHHRGPFEGTSFLESSVEYGAKCIIWHERQRGLSGVAAV
jgi:hypothetical protein